MQPKFNLDYRSFHILIVSAKTKHRDIQSLYKLFSSQSNNSSPMWTKPSSFHTLGRVGYVLKVCWLPLILTRTEVTTTGNIHLSCLTKSSNPKILVKWKSMQTNHSKIFPIYHLIIKMLGNSHFLQVPEIIQFNTLSERKLMFTPFILVWGLKNGLNPTNGFMQ